MKNEFVSLWREKSKKSKFYFIGKLDNGIKIVAFYGNKKNSKAPDIILYQKGEELKEIMPMWLKTSKNGAKYLSGRIGDKFYVGFINSDRNAENRKPYIKIYRQEPIEKNSGTARKQDPKAKADENGDMPF